MMVNLLYTYLSLESGVHDGSMCLLVIGVALEAGLAPKTDKLTTTSLSTRSEPMTRLAMPSMRFLSTSAGLFAKQATKVRTTPVARLTESQRAAARMPYVCAATLSSPWLEGLRQWLALHPLRGSELPRTRRGQACTVGMSTSRWASSHRFASPGTTTPEPKRPGRR
jgi:hypothetical protein